jgi:hypothetical protein
MRGTIRAAPIGRQGAAILQLGMSGGVPQCRAIGKFVVNDQFEAGSNASLPG